MTEDEARQKWCPFARVRQCDDMKPTYNRLLDADDEFEPNSDPECRCIASDCMAFRWAYPKEGPREEWHGYCGLAGDDHGS